MHPPLCQAVFSLLDVLQRWSEDAKAAALRGRSRGVPTDTGRPLIEGDAQWSALLRLLEGIPKQALAQVRGGEGADLLSLAAW